MKEIIDVNTGEVKFGSGQIVLRSLAIGSCVVIPAYDRRRKAGAMAHVMLPGEAPLKASNKTKYASNAIDKIFGEMAKDSSAVSDIEVCLVGAGNVLQKEDDTICAANIESVTLLLKAKGILIRATALGGVTRKSIFLDTENGAVSCIIGDGNVKDLWKPEI